jgi:hypothetical protein
VSRCPQSVHDPPIRTLPEKIAEADKNLANVREDIATRDARQGAAKAPTYDMVTWRDDITLQPRALRASKF